ncbi:MAG: exodeoxyribonuclease VII large subunit [Tenericutes bacterium]|jgi:exodeoxyribonuclease VII large subunit|nr:exodeoxyribonuclease VII large subunit [Mycoplasmatota bacterium]
MPRYLTVTALNRYLKYKLDSDSELQSILLKAEISNFKRHSRGHLYLTLKDEKSQVSAVMFSSHTGSLNFKPKDGDKIIIQGYVSVYEPYGNYQVYITKMEMDGIGDLYMAYEKLKKELEKEGLFNDEHKLPLPKLPKTVGVITSKTGAAVRDIINVIGTRFPMTKIIVYPASVQGVLAKGEIVHQINKANRDSLCDCLIVGRGGGSIEDLWPFNEEAVARAIYNSKIPIISAVGHETDFTIADFVADKRASTPSHAAELVVPHHKDIENNIDNYQSKLNSLLTNKYQNLVSKYKNLVTSQIFKQPLRIIQTQELTFNHAYDRLTKNNPKNLIKQKYLELNQLDKILQTTYKHSIERKQHQFARLAENLEYVNPLSIMTKGYSLVKQNKQIKKSINDINKGEPLDIQMHDGDIHCKIIDMKGTNYE